MSRQLADPGALDPGAEGAGRSTRSDGPMAVAVAAVLMWVLELADAVLDHRLDRFGIRPHTWAGLRGIPAAPLLHDGFGHLAANTVPFVALGTLTALSGLRRIAVVTLAVVAASGATVWLLGSSSELHLGASGVVFGYLGYLGARAVFERRLLSILVAVLAAVMFGGILRGVLPGADGISWEGHLGGFLGGIGVARLLHPPRRAGS